MPSADDDQSSGKYRHSVLDRLLGIPDDVSRNRVANHVRSRREVRIQRQVEQDALRARRDPLPADWIIAAVKEDLQCLLSATRPKAFEQAGEDDPLYRSLWTYGLFDMSNRTPAGAISSDQFAAAVRDAIERFEPRLCDVNVSAEAETAQELSIRLRITAKLVLQSKSALPITLDTRMWLDSRKIDMTGGVDGGAAGPSSSE